MRVAVVGAGAAGLMAAAAAASAGADVTLYERNAMAGKKLLIAGKGRCNFTRDCAIDELVDGFAPHGKFLYSALSGFGPEATCGLMQSLGVDYKVERGKRVFPKSDRAADVRDALLANAAQSGAKLAFGHRIVRIGVLDGAVTSVADSSGASHSADSVVVTTGGASYPGTGSTGDGYAMAASLGHTVSRLLPALVPLETVEDWPRSLMGLSLRNVMLTLDDGGRDLASEFGEMLFTHFGVGGPIVLTLSRKICTTLRDGGSTHPGRFSLRLDLKPALDEPTLSARIRRDLSAGSRRQLKNTLDALMPKALVEHVIRESGVDGITPANQVTVEQRSALVSALKGMRMGVARTRPLEEAIVTSGGVSTREVQPGTMESKLVKGLYFAGEVLDLDGPTGGYNLQAAFATGRLAGLSAAGGRG